jgi:arsenate reductase (thioredoxin)
MSRTARVLFLCMGNSCRSQMAEALVRSLGKGRIDCYSAGQKPEPVHPLTVKTMAEVGIDISTQTSKSLDRFAGEQFDFVITVCDRAKELCPAWPDVREQIHWSIDDPAGAAGSEEQRSKAFRRARDEIRQRIQLFMLANRLV